MPVFECDCGLVVSTPAAGSLRYCIRCGRVNYRSDMAHIGASRPPGKGTLPSTQLVLVRIREKGMR